MTSTPRNIIPVSPEGDEDVSREARVTRPAAEKVTPSQQGRFLGALEKKEPKKIVKPGTENAEAADEAEGAEEPVEGGTVFHLAKAKPVKKDGSSGESFTGEESEDEGKATVMIPEQKPVMPTQPTAAQQQMVAASQPQPLPRPIEGPKEKVETVVPERGAVRAARLTSTPEETVPTAPRDVGAFRKLMEEKGKGAEQIPEHVAAMIGPQRPAVTPTSVGEAAQPVERPMPTRQAIMEVLRQTADAIATFVSKHEVRTVVTIKQPPIFEGATLTVTEYSSAPHQFNITFENLSPDARRLLESTANQQTLKQSLVERGYTVQNVFVEATSRPAVTPIVTETKSESQTKKEFGDEDQGTGGSTGGEAGGAQ